ncbi:MAG: hypothetical protein R3B06_06180 [Kofleriaceae bacterium]
MADRELIHPPFHPRRESTMRLLTLSSLLVLAGAAGCTEAPSTGDTPELPQGNASAGTDNTFDHPGTNVDVWELLDRLKQEGPARYSSRVHGCAKLKYATLGNLLASRGVDLGNTAALSAGRLYRDSDQALAAPNYAARQAETRELSTATASKMFDIYVQAAPEIIANLGATPACQIAGQGVELFNADNQCNLDGITCLIGVPATASHVELCNLAVQRASDADKGKRIAVATLLAAAHTCE